MKFQALAIGVLALWGAHSANSQQLQSVRIGLVGPMSGPIAQQGKDIRNAGLMAVDDLNGQKLVIGGKPVSFTLEVEDDAADPKQGVAAAQKLCDTKVAGVVGHINSGTAIPAARIYEDCDVPFLTSGATNPKLTQLGYKNTYRMLANDDALAKGVAVYAASKLKVKRVAVVDDRTAYGQGVSDVFKREARAAGLEIIAEEFTTDKAVDFNAILTRIKSRNPDAIFFGGTDAQAAPMLRQIEQLGMSVGFLGGDGVCTVQMGILAAGVKALERVVCAEGGSSVAKMPQGPDWKKRYDNRFPNEYALFSPYTYDAVMVLVDAMKRANSTDPAIFRKELPRTNYRGVTTAVQFDGKGDLKDAAITLYTFKNNKREPLN